MNDHIPDATKMISDTPISDSTAHNVGDLGMLCRRLERKLAATRRYLSEVTERAKRLEEAGDALANTQTYDLLATVNWRKAKEAQP
jgi:hypothetical protein